MVAMVPMTPIFPDFVTLRASFTPGSTTPKIGISGKVSFRKFRATLDTVLQAITINLTLYFKRNITSSTANFLIVFSDFVP